MKATRQELLQRIEDLEGRLMEAEETLRAVREGEVDAIVVSGSKGEQIFSLAGAESVYRLIVETMKEAAFTVAYDGRILFCNSQFGELIRRPLGQIIGHLLQEFIAPGDQDAARALMVTSRTQPAKQRLVFENVEGAPVPAHVSANMINQQDGPSICIVATELTELENSTAMLQQLRSQQEALRESEERYRLVSQATNDAIYDVDLGSGKVRFNESYTRLFGQPPETGDPWNWWVDRIHPEDRDEAVNCIRAAMDGDASTWSCEYRSLRPDGTWADVFDRAYIARTEEGRADRLVGAVADLTERKRAEQELRRREIELRTITENAPEIIGRVDRRLRHVFMNRGITRATGRFPEEYLGKTNEELGYPPKLCAKWSATYRQVFEAGRPCEMEFSFGAQAGPKHFNMRAVPEFGRDGRVESVLFVTTDITERKRAEEEVRKANEQLREASRRKDEFLAMLAHELRNPLAPVRNAVEVLRLAGGREDIRRRQQEIIDRQVAHMARLLDDLLDVSRVTRGAIELHRRPLDLMEVLAHAVEVVSPLVQARRHTLHFEPPPEHLRVEADLDRLSQAVGNLLINAAKYTEEGGQIWLEASCENAEAIIRVRDNGAGISPDLLSRVFDIFTQADRSLGRSQGGLGIGLTMVQKLVQMHGGTVVAHSEGLGRGSEFIVRLPALPVAAPSPSRPEYAAASPRPSRCLRILVVDDSADSAESMAELLRIWHHEVRTAFSGPAGLDAAREFQPELVLLDIGMPGMDGYETARRLRAQLSTDDLMLVAMTGYGQESDREESRRAGFDDHLVKPVDLTQLEKVLERMEEPPMPPLTRKP